MFLHYNPDFPADYFSLPLDSTLYCLRYWRQAHLHLQKTTIVHVARFSLDLWVCWQESSFFCNQQFIRAARSNCYRNFIIFLGNTFKLLSLLTGTKLQHDCRPAAKNSETDWRGQFRSVFNAFFRWSRTL